MRPEPAPPLPPCPLGRGRPTGGGRAPGAEARGAGPVFTRVPLGERRHDARGAGRRHRSAAPPPSRSAVASGIGSAIRGSLLTAPAWTPERTQPDLDGGGVSRP